MSGRKRTFLIALALILALALALAAGMALHLRDIKSNPMQAFQTPILSASPAATPQPTSAPTPSPTLSPEEELAQTADQEFMRNRVNILMLGWDQSPEREDEDSELYRDEKNNFRSDVMMVLSVGFESGDVDLISIPRDTMARIYNVEGRWKINAAFAKGGSVAGDGFLYAVETVQNLLGVPINHYAGVDMVGLKTVVDAMGGVDYDVDVRIALNGRVLEKGYQHLSGQQVLDYCRARKGISTDVGRADRQQRMLFAILTQLKSRDQLKNLPRVYLSVQDKVHTDLNLEQIAALTLFAMDLDMEADLNRHTLAGEYISGTPYSGASYYVLDMDKLKSLIKEIFGADIQPDYRYDYRYVQADKAAAQGLAFADCADYLGAHVIYDSYALQQYGVLEAAQAVRGLAQRAIPVSWSQERRDKALQQPLDKKAIETATQDLATRLYALCSAYNITQAHVNKKMVPAALYNLLVPGYAGPSYG